MKYFLLLFFGLESFAIFISAHKEHNRVKCVEGDVAVYRAHPLNCKEYYQCVHDRFVKKVCPGETYWNSEQNICVLNVACDD